MITFELSPDVLGHTRFAFSPLGEATYSLRLLGSPNPASVHMPWLRRARESLAGVDLALLMAVAAPGRWVATFMVPTASPSTTIEEQLQDLTHMSPVAMARDLGEVWADSGTPRRGQQLLGAGPRAPGVLAETIWNYWDAVIAPHWPRMCGVLEGDVSHRLTRLVSDGLFGLLADLHPDVALDGHLLNIDKPQHATARFTASEMTLVPSVFVWPTVVLDDGLEGTFAVTYPARGVGQLWEGLGEMIKSDGNSLGNLLGRTRAAVLGLTAVPTSTTAIARELGQSPSTISQHLSVLREAGLVNARRSGKSVLYSQTPLAISVVKAEEAKAKLRPPDGSRRMQVK